MAERGFYHHFHVSVRERIALSPSLLRLVFTGPDVEQMICPGPDQRVKVFFLLPGQAAPQPPEGDDWYPRYRALPPQQRPPMRTYTLRALRAAQAQVDIDFVLHGEHGPASRWAAHARRGDHVVLLAPLRGRDEHGGGYEWNPPAGLRRLLLAGDETALPALANILRELSTWPVPPSGDCLIEVPLDADVLALPPVPGIDMHWLPRNGAGHGQRLLETTKTLFPGAPAAPARPPEALAAALPADGILWEPATGRDRGFHAWIAGEAGVVMALRRHLTGTAGLDRDRITFMGYWRRGHALD